MVSKDWALVAFTLLSQMAVGTFLVAWLTRLLARRQGGELEAKKLCAGPLLIVGPLAVLAMLASLFHLAAPQNAWLTLSNVGTSWLSREILFVVAFTVMWCVSAFLQWRSIGSERTQILWAVVTGVVGLLLVYATSMAYMLPTRPAWDSPSTPLFFYGTTFGLGALAAATMFGIYHRRTAGSSETQTNLVRMALSLASVIVMVVIVVQALAILFQVAFLIGNTAQAQLSAQLLLGPNAAWFWLRILLGIIGGFALAAVTWRTLANTPKGVPSLVTNLVFLTFSTMLLAEIIGRMLFYSTIVPVKPV